MSAYFMGSKPSNPLQSPAADALTTAAKKGAEPKVVKVRAHTRTIKPKPKKDAPAAKPAVAQPSVRPAQVSTEKRYVPHFRGEPPAGYVTGWQGGTEAEADAPHPYYTDAYTTRHGAGPTGQQSTQWNAAQVAAAKQMQIKNYGMPGYILRSALPGGADEGGINTGNAVSRVASVATTALPGGGVGEGAALFGFGLKGLRVARAAKGARAGEEAAATSNSAARAGKTYYHVAPKSQRANIEQGGLQDKLTGQGVFLWDNPADAQTYHKLVGGDIWKVRGDAVKVHPDPWWEQPGRREAWSGPGQSVVSHESIPPSALDRHGAPAVSAHVTDEAAIVRGALPGAKVLRGKQEAGYSVERSKRVAAARVHLDDPSLTPDQRVKLAKGELRGELPKINFKGFSELNDESLTALQTHILDHPHLMPFQKIRASDALVGALSGKVPTRGEIALLEHVFGKDTAAGLGSLSKNPFRDKLLNALNIPRSLMSSFDLSAPFRQGLMVSTRHPKIFAQNFGPMVKSFGSEKVYHAAIEEIRARPTYPLMMEAKLPLTELGADVGMREERFASEYAEKLTGGKYSPVRASGRAYTGFLDKTRADVFDHLIQRAQAQGIDVQNTDFLRSLGKYIGSATGRGDLGAFQEAGKVLNAVFFSPRLLASRLNFLNPAYYARLDPFARKEALRSALQLAGTLSVLLTLADKVTGVKVVHDPRNADWGKIKIGNTRIDIAGGFQQELRLLAQLASGVAISSTTGKKMSLTAGGFGQPTRLDIAQRFFMGKESPVASFVTDAARGSNLIGEPFDLKTAAAQRMIPLLSQDSYDIYKEHNGGMNGLAAAFAGYGVGMWGVGTQTYGPTEPKVKTKKPADYFGGGSSGGSPYFGSPARSGGGGYFGGGG